MFVEMFKKIAVIGKEKTDKTYLIRIMLGLKPKGFKQDIKSAEIYTLKEKDRQYSIWDIGYKSFQENQNLYSDADIGFVFTEEGFPNIEETDLGEKFLIKSEKKDFKVIYICSKINPEHLKEYILTL